MKISLTPGRRCQRCGCPLNLIEKDGRKVCAKCLTTPELTQGEIEKRERRERPSSN